MSLVPAATCSELLVRIYTDSGIIGLGHVDAWGVYKTGIDGDKRAAGAACVAREELVPLLVGEDPLDNERLWQKMFAATYTKGWSLKGWRLEDFMAAIAVMDMAVWDIKAKAVEQPVYKLLGAYRDRVPCYVAGGYYRDGKDVEDLVMECTRYVKDGFPAIKIRVGGVSVEEDITRVKAVREAIGPGTKLMLDANGAYDTYTAIQAAKAFAPMDIFWFEEPVHWYDEIDGPKRVKEATGVPIASGEHARNRWEARHLIQHSALDYMQFDCMMSGGPTEWLKVASLSSSFGVPVAPHHGPNIHAHLVAAVPNGLFVEYFPDPRDYKSEEELFPIRYDLMRELFSVFPEVRDGNMILPEKPGWGFELNEDVVAKRTISF